MPTTRRTTRSRSSRGDAKEKVGGATGDEALRRQGERDQTKANLKQAGEKVKDAFKN